MPRIILLLAIGLIVYIVYKRIQAMPAAQQKSAWLKVGLVGLVVVVALATVSGRMHWLGAAITGLLVFASRMLPTLIRLFPVLQWLNRQRGPAGTSGNQQSQVETALLRMTLDHASGDIGGEVLDGEFSGQQLDDLDQPQLESLLGWCQSRDVDSARLLESYLQRRFGDDWSGDRTPPPQQSGDMSRSEALAILGLEDGASEKDIVTAHRQLMQKLHPDRGGNDYLAAKLNQAKDLLLG